MTETVCDYHVTTPLTTGQEIAAIWSAREQNDAVISIFRAHPRRMSPSEVHSLGVARGLTWLLTSVRRSMTNLSRDGALVHYRWLHKPGPYGRPETLWGLPEQGVETAA